jgi:hypothetical protein
MSAVVVMDIKKAPQGAESSENGLCASGQRRLPPRSLRQAHQLREV